MLNRPDEVATSTKCVIDHNRDALLMRQLGDPLKIRHIVPRVTDALQIHSLRLVVNGGSQFLGLVAVNELAVDAQPRERDFELVVGAAVQVGRRHDVVARVCQRSDSHELCGLAR